MDLDQEEEQSFLRVISALQQYEMYQLQWLEGKRKMFDNLPRIDLQRLISKDSNVSAQDQIDAHLEKIQSCIHKNQMFLNTVTLPYDELFPEERRMNRDGPIAPAPAKITAFHSEMEKVKSTLRQISREWSEEGKQERDQSFAPILTELEKLFPRKNDRKRYKVLTPGCGLGRLSWEIANMGFVSQGNEFSFFMLVTSNAILNLSKTVNQNTIYPFLHSFCNVKTGKNQIKKVQFPDVAPSLPAGSDFSMSAGDFLEIYTEPNTWDCIVTCFFLDTAHNIIEYVKCINHILQPGGYWINNGPLLYHWADMPGEESVEITLAQLYNVIDSFGLIVKHRKIKDCKYTGSYKGMMSLMYHAELFVVEKPLL